MQKRIGLPSEDGLRLSNERRGAPLGSKGGFGVLRLPIKPKKSMVDLM